MPTAGTKSTLTAPDPDLSLNATLCHHQHAVALAQPQGVARPAPGSTACTVAAQHAQITGDIPTVPDAPHLAPNSVPCHAQATETNLTPAMQSTATVCSLHTSPNALDFPCVYLCPFVSCELSWHSK